MEVEILSSPNYNGAFVSTVARIKKSFKKSLIEKGKIVHLKFKMDHSKKIDVGDVLVAKAELKIKNNKIFGNVLNYTILSKRSWPAIDKCRNPGLGILLSVTTGNRYAIPQDIKRHFHLSGCGHILVVSGLHVGIIFFLTAILTRATIGLLPYVLLNFDLKKIIYVSSTIFVFIYSLITGFRTPTKRAFLMASIFSISYLIKKRVDLLNVLFDTAFLLLFINPNEIYSKSFQLSFITVFYLILLYKAFPIKSSNLKGYTESLIKGTLFATLATIPLTLRYFHIIPFFAPISNLFIIPIFSFFIIPFGILSMITKNRYVSDLFLDISLLSSNLSAKVCEIFGKDNFHLFAKSPSILQILLFYLGLLLITVKKGFIYPALFLTISILLYLSPQRNLSGIDLTLFKDKSILVETPSNSIFFERCNNYKVLKHISKILDRKQSIDILVIEKLPSDISFAKFEAKSLSPKYVFVKDMDPSIFSAIFGRECKKFRSLKDFLPKGVYTNKKAFFIKYGKTKVELHKRRIKIYSEGKEMKELEKLIRSRLRKTDIIISIREDKKISLKKF